MALEHCTQPHLVEYLKQIPQIAIEKRLSVARCVAWRYRKGAIPARRVASVVDLLADLLNLDDDTVNALRLETLRRVLVDATDYDAADVDAFI